MSNVSVAAVYTSFQQQSPVQRECFLSSIPQAVNQLSKTLLSCQLSNSQTQGHNSSNMIGGIFQLKALLFNSMLNQRYQSCRNRLPEVSQGQHYSHHSSYRIPDTAKATLGKSTTFSSPRCNDHPQPVTASITNVGTA